MNSLFYLARQRVNKSYALNAKPFHSTELQTMGSYGIFASKIEGFRDYFGAAIWDCNSPLGILLSL